MADEDGGPVWAQFLRSDLAAFRSEINSRLDKLVSQDAFRAEHDRVEAAAQSEHRWTEGQIRQLTQDLKDEREERLQQGSHFNSRFKRAWFAARWVFAAIASIAGIVVAVVFH